MNDYPKKRTIGSYIKNVVLGLSIIAVAILVIVAIATRADHNFMIYTLLVAIVLLVTWIICTRNEKKK